MKKKKIEENERLSFYLSSTTPNFVFRIQNKIFPEMELFDSWAYLPHIMLAIILIQAHDRKKSFHLHNAKTLNELNRFSPCTTHSSQV